MNVMNAMLLSDRNNYLNDTKAYIIQMILAIFLLENCKIFFFLISIEIFVLIFKTSMNFDYEYIQKNLKHKLC